MPIPVPLVYVRSPARRVHNSGRSMKESNSRSITFTLFWHGCFRFRFLVPLFLSLCIQVKLTRLVLRPRPTVRNIPADDRSAAVLHRSRRQDHWLYGAAVKQQLAGVGEMWLYVFSTLQQRGLPTPANYASRSFHSRACLAGKLSLEVFLLNQDTLRSIAPPVRTLLSSNCSSHPLVRYGSHVFSILRHHPAASARPREAGKLFLEVFLLDIMLRRFRRYRLRYALLSSLS
jgi:hypothetical protein